MPTARRASRAPRSRSAVCRTRTDRLDPVARHLDDARAALGERAWQKAWAEGAELGFDAALSLGDQPRPRDPGRGRRRSLRESGGFERCPVSAPYAVVEE